MGIDRDAIELNAVVPILADGKVIATCTFVTAGTPNGKTIGIASAERLRVHQGAKLVVPTRLDGSETVPVASWQLSFGGIALVELGAPLPASGEVTALSIGSVCATVDTRGAPAALVVVEQAGKGFKRTVIQVDVDLVDGGGMTDVITRLATPREQVSIDADGSTLFAWLPANPALGRRPETVLVALGIAYRLNVFKPRALPALVELAGLDELGRALAIKAAVPPPRDELKMVAGEIVLDKD